MSLAGGVTAFEGGPVCYNIPYYAELPLEVSLERWRYVDRQAEARETAKQHASRALHVYQDEDGMVVIRGRLEPEAGTLVLKALAAAYWHAG